jgi:hypothetical protein
MNPSEWLSTRNVKVLRTAVTGELDETFDRLARFLGERFHSIRPFYEAIKRRVGGHPYPRAVKLTDAPPRMITDICQFASDLYNNGFLSRYRYHKETRTLVFDLQMDGRVVNFFTGDWLERYALLTAQERIETLLPEGIEPDVLTKAAVSLPDGQDTELDILLGLPDRVLWLECKTGDWQEHAVKFGRVARQLCLPPEHAALVLLEPLAPEQKRNASALARMTAINPEELEEFIETALGVRSVPPSLAPQAMPVTPPGVAAVYTAWLNKCGIRPLDVRLRRQIISDLTRLNTEEQVALPELINRLQNEYQAAGTAVSKRQINDVVSALRRAGICVRKSHLDYPAGVWFLRTDVAADEMLKRCALLYLWTLLKNPACPTSGALDKSAVADIVHWDIEAMHEDSQFVEELLEELGTLGVCQRVGSEWIAIGETFVVGDPLPDPEQQAS